MIRRTVRFGLGVIGLTLDGLALLRHLVLGTEPAWVERMRRDVEDMEREP